MPAVNDPAGRCADCIRLKKDCSFFPVDQQPTTDPRQKSASRASVGPKITSASSSPAMSNGYPPLNMAPPSLKSETTDSYPPDMKSESKLQSPMFQGGSTKTNGFKVPPGASTARPYPEYGSHGMTNWMAPDSSPGRSFAHDSPMTPAFSSYTQPGLPQPPPPNWTSPVPADSSREDMYWGNFPPPQRSFSFGTESVSSQAPQYPPIQPMSSRAYERKAATMYSPPIAPTVMTPSTQYGASPSQGPPGYNTWQQPYPNAKPDDGYGVWYGENGAPPPMAPGEQHGTPQGENRPPGSDVYYTPR